MTEIENTSQRDPLLHLMGAMSDGGSGYIEGMEAAGQRQLVHSDRLPTECGDDEAMVALGFRFGEPDPADQLFRPATLPEGWRKQGSDHSMWSHIVDELGRKRVAVFYKAAFYDRRAFMRLETVYGYVSELLYEGGTPVFDDQWCTRAAVADVLTARREELTKREGLYASKVGDPGVPWAADELKEIRSDLAKLGRFAAEARVN